MGEGKCLHFPVIKNKSACGSTVCSFMLSMCIHFQSHSYILENLVELECLAKYLWSPVQSPD